MAICTPPKGCSCTPRRKYQQLHSVTAAAVSATGRPVLPLSLPAVPVPRCPVTRGVYLIVRATLHCCTGVPWLFTTPIDKATSRVVHWQCTDTVDAKPFALGPPAVIAGLSTLPRGSLVRGNGDSPAGVGCRVCTVRLVICVAGAECLQRDPARINQQERQRQTYTRVVTSV